MEKKNTLKNDPRQKKALKKVKKESITPAMSHHSVFSEMLIMTLMMNLVEKALPCGVRRPGSSPHSAL